MFTPVPASLFADKFTAAGFTRTVVNREVVYERPHAKLAGVVIRVFTSCSDGSSECREAGSDAVRACLVYRHKGFAKGLGKATRVNRTGTPEAVVERALERAREMYGKANTMAKDGVCKCCNGPVWSDSKNCLFRCWSRN